jgi:glycosyltransferase involved in cell wall biosynthesis
MYRMIASIDDLLIERAEHVVVPDECRILERYGRLRTEISVIRNTSPAPTDKYKPPISGNTLRVMVSGYLGRFRGIEKLMDAVGGVDWVTIVAAGHSRDVDIVSELRGLPNTEWHGRLPQEDAARLTSTCDVVFTFYDPSVPINRLAASNKWGDALAVGLPIVVNSEVVKSAWLEREGVACRVAFQDSRQLRAVLLKLHQERDRRRQMGSNALTLYESSYSWDDTVRAWMGVVDRAYGR